MEEEEEYGRCWRMRRVLAPKRSKRRMRERERPLVVGTHGKDAFPPF